MRVSTMEKRADECDRLIEQAETHRLFLASHVEVLTTELTRIRERFNAKLAGAAGALKEVFHELDQQDAKARRRRAPAGPKQAPQVEQTPLQFLPPEGRELTPDELFDV